MSNKLTNCHDKTLTLLILAKWTTRDMIDKIRVSFHEDMLPVLYVLILCWRLFPLEECFLCIKIR